MKNNAALKRKKILSSIAFALSVILFIIAISVFIVALKAKKENKPASFFGYSFSVVVSPSMEPEIKVGDFVLVKETVVMSEIKEGDNVVFTSKDPTIAGLRVVHKVVKIAEDEDGLYFVTKGVNNPVEDGYFVREDNFVGMEVFHSTALGIVFGFFSRTENLIFLVILFITIPAVVNLTKKIVVYVKESKAENKTSSTASSENSSISSENVSMPASNDTKDEGNLLNNQSSATEREKESGKPEAKKTITDIATQKDE